MLSFKKQDIYAAKIPQHLVLEFLPDAEIMIWFKKHIDKEVVIDWGTKQDVFSSGQTEISLSHTYKSGDKCILKVKDVIHTTVRGNLKSILSWGNIVYEGDCSSMFMPSPTLLSIAKPTKEVFSKAQSLEGAFKIFSYDCQLPDYFFSNISLDYLEARYNDTSIRSPIDQYQGKLGNYLYANLDGTGRDLGFAYELSNCAIRGDTKIHGVWKNVKGRHINFTDAFRIALYNTPQTTYIGDDMFNGVQCATANLFGFATGIRECEIGNRWFANTVGDFNLSYMFNSSFVLRVGDNWFANSMGTFDCSGMFFNCSKLISVQDTFFHGANITGLVATFKDCSTLVSAPKLWLTHPDIPHEECYMGCTSLPWYDEIPADWK